MSKKLRSSLVGVRNEILRILGKSYPNARMGKARAYTTAIVETLLEHVEKEVLSREELILCLIAATEYLTVATPNTESATKTGKDDGES